MKPKTEAEWEAESDARTITEADAIKADPRRYGAAKDAAKRMLEEAEEKAKSLKKLAGATMNYDKSPKPPKRINPA